MAAVPKLNYANLRGARSVSKPPQNPNPNTNTNTNSDLFSHMQNLKYIQTQIKQKQKRTHVSTPQPEPNTLLNSVNPREENKGMPEEESGVVKVVKTEGQNFPELSRGSGDLSKKESEEGNNKLSNYDIVSQDKSNRLQSLEEDDAHHFDKDQTGFLNFLSSYIDDLGANGKHNAMKKKKPTKRVQMNMSQSSGSSNSQKQILLNRVAEQKMKNAQLANLIEQYRSSQSKKSSRIDMLQKYLLQLHKEVQELKSSIPNPNPQQSRPHQQWPQHIIPQYNHHHHHHHHHDRSQQQRQNTYQQISSSRNNHTSFSVRSSNQPTSRNNREAEKQLNQLENQYHLFRSTGEWEVVDRRSHLQYQHFY